LAAANLDAETLKLASYDSTLLMELGSVVGKNVLDYGCGPGVLCAVLKSLGAEVKGFDINSDMLIKTAEKIGSGNVITDPNQIPENSFDIVICNLVLCIVSEEEAENIIKNIRRFLKPDGVAYIGFCNPKIHNKPESQLDFRFFSGHDYFENHAYKKIKKEGVYEIVENHRPVDWYTKLFFHNQLILLDILLTPEYQIRNDKINDFVIFKLQK
jgi:2-polyprenyl-3-methyl-5-hydroxy-6-metoxy-1,4-benzoquinol methylase